MADDQVERGPGKPPFKPSDEQRAMVSAMVSYGIPHLEIASVIGISPNTLAKHFRNEIDTASARATTEVANALFDQAVNKGNTSAQIFWLKTRGRWRETNHHDLTSSDGSMSPAAIDTSKLSDAALKELMDARDSDR